MDDLRILFNELVRLETELWDAVDDRLRAEHGLPLGRFEVMQLIDRAGACRVLDIATSLSITVGGVSKIVDRIQADGHCRRRAHPGDGRSSLIELTPSGAALAAGAARTFAKELHTRVGSALDAGDTDRLTDTLSRLRTAVRAKEPSATTITGS